MNIEYYLNEQKEEVYKQVNTCIKVFKMFDKLNKKFKSEMTKLHKFNFDGIDLKHLQEECPHYMTKTVERLGFEDYKHTFFCKICHHSFIKYSDFEDTI